MNSIELFKKNAPELLDKVYQQSAKTAVLDCNSDLVKAGANANEIVIPKLDMDGLGDFDRNSGYLDGDVKLTNETVKFNYERGRRLKTDAIDNEETGGVILANLSGEFVRTKVVPEVDAVRFAHYASTPNITVKSETIESGETAIKSIAAVYDGMTTSEVPEDSRYLFIEPTINGLIRDLDTTKSKELMKRFAGIIEVPKSRFYTAIELLSGKDEDGERVGGYKKADNGMDINYMIIEKSAVLQHTKHAKTKIFTPDQDQDGDDYKMLYRLYGLNDTYENKAAGIAVSHKPAA